MLALHEPSPYLSTHKLRFTSASLAKNQGQCEQDIQHNLGHSNIQQTQHYDSHATTEYNYGMAADIYDKKYNVTKCNQTFEHKKIAPNLDKWCATRQVDKLNNENFFFPGTVYVPGCLCNVF